MTIKLFVLVHSPYILQTKYQGIQR